jgi:hypothetical protein
MSELDTSLRGLRDELHAAIPVPSVGGVAGRARTRRRTQLAAIVAVIAVALAVPVLRSFSTSVEPAERPRPAQSFVVDFADADHGYALATHCPENGEGCSFSVYATTDGGRSWQRRVLPGPASSYLVAELYVLGPDLLAIDRRNSRLYSADAGRSWQEVAYEWPANEGAPISPGGLLTGVCVRQPSTQDVCRELGTIVPGTGKTRTVPSQPPLYLKRIGSTATAGGRWWTTGRNTATGKWSVAVSGDAGRSWATSKLAVAGVPSVDGWSLVERNGVMYLTANDVMSLLGVWRSTDDGGTWTPTWFMSERTGLPRMVGSPVAAGDGTLILSDGKSTYVSTDQGLTFRRTGDDPHGTVRWTRAGYLRADGDEFAVSVDGLRWRTFTIR